MSVYCQTISHQRRYYILLSIHQILMLTSLCFVHRFVCIAGVSFPLSALIFPLTFLTTDLAAAFSYRQAKHMMWLGILAQLPFAMLCMLADLLPVVSETNHAAYHLVFAGVLRTACASIIGCAVGQAVNIYVFSKLQKLQQLRFAVRYLIAAAIGQSVFTVIALPIIFSGAKTSSALMPIILGSIAAKIVYSLVLSLLSGGIMHWFNHNPSSCRTIDISKYQHFTTIPQVLQQPSPNAEGAR